MFQHGYDNYMIYGYPYGELHPLTCQSGTFDLVKLNALTLIDSLDMLLIMNNVTEFARATERLRILHNEQPLFHVDQNVSVFETNIRVLGGLLSAHQLAIAYNLDNTLKSTNNNNNNNDKPLLQDVFDNYPSTNSVKWGYDENKIDEEDSCEVLPTIDTTFCNSDSLSLIQDCVIPKIQQEQTNTDNNNNVCKLNQTKTTTTRIKHKNNNYYWKYDGFLLELAIDIGYRLLPAFNTKTGIPYGTVNLLYGVPNGETPIASLAGGGTLTLEFELLSRLSGNTEFSNAAKLSSRALFARRSKLDLFGKHINTKEGGWTETLSGIGSNSDSFLEYLAKHYFLYPDNSDDFWVMLYIAYNGIFHHTRLGEWYTDIDMFHGNSKIAGRRIFESLAAFYPGMQILLGEITPAARSLNSFFLIREALGFLPERFNYNNWNLDYSRDGPGIHPLRPELLESSYFLHRSTIKDGNNDSSTGWQWASDFALHKIESITKTKCGYAGLRELHPQTTGSIGNNNNEDKSSQQQHKSSSTTKKSIIKRINEMPSFFLSETLKYLYLTYDNDNFLHTDTDHEWIFTTEAHPIHYVPAPKKKKATKTNKGNEFDNNNNNNVGEFDNDIIALKNILKSRLYDNPPINTRSSYISRTKQAVDMMNEKWTYDLDHKAFRNELDGIISGIVSLRNQYGNTNVNRPSFLVSPIIQQSKYIIDTYNEIQEMSNPAHMSVYNLGFGSMLQKACINFHNTGLLWLYALNGGSTDYSDIYMSVITDTPLEINNYTLFGAIDALGFLGTGNAYPGSGYRTNYYKFCPIPNKYSTGTTGAATSTDNVSTKQQQQQESSTTTTASSGSGTTASKTTTNTEDGDGILRIPSDIGNFEISTSTDGSGFLVRQVDTGEFISTNIVYDEMDTNEHFAMVYTELRTSNDDNDAGFTDVDTSVPSSVEDAEQSTTNPASISDDESVTKEDFKRRVSIADFSGNSFSCDIKVIRMLTESLERDGDTTNEELLLTIPCSPAMFGPSQISRLRDENEVKFEAVVIRPQNDNYMGCAEQPPIQPEMTQTTTTPPELLELDIDETNHISDSPEILSTDFTDDAFSCLNRSIHIVHRGQCTFLSKAVNMRTAWNAGAVIVVNNHEGDLFVMSSGLDELNDIPQDNIPLTVLISAYDGDDFLTILNDDSNEDSSIFARISLKRRSSMIDTDGIVRSEEKDDDESQETVHWPVVRGSNTILQVLAEFGWGIQAMQTPGQKQKEWQLQLLRHNKML